MQVIRVLQSIIPASALLALSSVPSASAQSVAQTISPPGDAKSAKTRTLELGAKILQPNRPVDVMDIYLDGFHPMKDHPEMQMEAHHFCHQVNEDFAQCALFDGNSKSANLNGIEYIISEKLFATLPEGERKYWHPHDGEILSGQLVAPGIPAEAEKALMKKKMNSYGKTWHLWNTGMIGMPADKLPLGEPMLAWSFNQDGEAAPGLVEQRDKRMGIDSAKLRRERADLKSLAHPQSGVDDLKGKFARPSSSIPGVGDAKSAPATAAATAH